MHACMHAGGREGGRVVNSVQLKGANDAKSEREREMGWEEKKEELATVNTSEAVVCCK